MLVSSRRISNRPDDLMTDNENIEVETTQEAPVRRGSGALIGRFLAVGLFVALGTFAVIQSISGDKAEPGDSSNLENSHSFVGNESEPESSVPDDVESPLDKSIASKPPSMPFTPVVKTSNTFLKPATTPLAAAAKQTSGTFGDGAASPPAPKTPPLNRIAMKQDGSALSRFGTGGPAIPPQVSGTISSLKDKVSSATQSTANRFNQIRSGLNDTASDATGRAKSAFGGAATSASDAASRFGAPKPPVVSTGSPFTQQPASNPIEAKSTLGSGSDKRPFSANPPRTGAFQSKPLNPISATTTQQARTPAVPPQPRAGGTTFPAKSSGTPSGLPRDPFSQTRSRSNVNSESTSRGTTFPPRNTTPPVTRNQTTRPPQRKAIPPQRTALPPQRTATPSSTSRAPAVQANYVSPKPGDRQYEGVQSPSMIIQKFSPREIQVNQTADFEVKIRNVGRVTVDDVLVVDQIPDGAEFIDANPKTTSRSRNGELKWQLGSMKPGEERTILLQLKPTVAGEIGSVAQFYFGSRATNRTKVTQPKLRITHTADPKILIGDDVVFDVIVENTGSGAAKDVVIQEEVPELLEYQDGSRELEYEIGTLQPGQSKRVKLGLRAARIGQLKNIMFASAKGGIQAEHTTDIEIIAPKLTTSSEGPTQRYIKRQVAHTFTVANNGTAAATNLRLIARLPSGLRFVDANNRGRYDRNSHSVVWQMRDLSAGGSGDVEVRTSPIEAGDQNIKFEASADLNQTSETVQNLTVKHLVDVFFDIDDVVDPIEIGGDTRYRIRMINQGTQAASNVQIQVDFPPGLEPTSVDGDLRNQIRGQQIVFEPITSLRIGEEMNVTISAKGRTDGDHRVVVNMQTDGRSTPVSKQETTRVYPDR